MNEIFRLLIDDHAEPAVNMARDESLLRRVIAGESPPCIRFYQWKPPGLSIGRFQSIDNGVDMEMCREHGVEVVRRLTGGEGVLHDDELTYSIMIPFNHPRFDGRGIIDSYRTISRALVKGLRDIGLESSMAGEGPTRADPMSGGVCFYTPTVYEVTSGGKKIVGSAQTREKGIILQHGSVPMDWDPDVLLDVTGIKGPEREQFKGFLLQRATTIKEQLGRRVEYRELSESFARAFGEVFDVELEESKYSLQEEKMTRFLVDTRYGKDDWNLKL